MLTIPYVTVIYLIPASTYGVGISGYGEFLNKTEFTVCGKSGTVVPWRKS